MQLPCLVHLEINVNSRRTVDLAGMPLAHHMRGLHALNAALDHDLWVTTLPTLLLKSQGTRHRTVCEGFGIGHAHKTRIGADEHALDGSSCKLRRGTRGNVGEESGERGVDGNAHDVVGRWHGDT